MCFFNCFYLGVTPKRGRAFGSRFFVLHRCNNTKRAPTVPQSLTHFFANLGLKVKNYFIFRKVCLLLCIWKVDKAKTSNFLYMAVHSFHGYLSTSKSIDGFFVKISKIRSKTRSADIMPKTIKSTGNINIHANSL